MNSDLTQLLQAAGRGDPAAAEAVWQLVYQELRALAAQKLAKEQDGATLQATALVHEAYLRMGARGESYQQRAHFFGAAAEAMRRILIDAARKRSRPKHGGDRQRVQLENIQVATDSDDETLMAVDEALQILEKKYPDHARLVKLRYFAGLNLEEASEMMACSQSTLKRHWAFARAFLIAEIKRGLSL